MEKQPTVFTKNRYALYEKIGIIGGMGPLVSAEFINRIYQYTSYDLKEQYAPSLILLSDPSIPDRTTCFLRGETEILLERLIELLDFLDQAGVRKVIICCITIHHLLPLLPIRYKEMIISLIDVIVEELISRQEPYLFLCTKGTMAMNILEEHEQWFSIQDQVCYLSKQDQEKIHDLIYTYLKRGAKPASIATDLSAIISRYAVSGVIAGCTELHLISPQNEAFANLQSYPIIDPLDILALKIASNCKVLEA